MGTKVTLTIPDYIYQQAKQVAQREKRPLSDVFNDALVQVFPAVHESPGRVQMEKEQISFRQMQARLNAQYSGEYVAIYQGQVVDHDDNLVELVSRIDQEYPDEIVLIKLVTTEPDRVIHMRSPRLVHE